jgi:hypothetical protein
MSRSRTSGSLAVRSKATVRRIAEELLRGGGATIVSSGGLHKLIVPFRMRSWECPIGL